MALQLKTVPPAAGARWLRDAFALFAKRPLGFTAMFAAFLVAAALLSVFPFVGGFVQLASMPLLSLGFMVAAREAVEGGLVHPGHFLRPLKADAARRRNLLVLCAIYGVLAFLVLMVVAWASDDALTRLQEAMAESSPESDEVRAILAEPGLSAGVLLLLGGGLALSIPFWHAPALVHWGGQGVAQSLFSSALAVWRCRGAFFVYALAWCFVVIAFALVTGLVTGLLGAPALGTALALGMGLVFTAVFYVSLLFTFSDSFGVARPAGDEPPPATEPAA
jgi:hypothetical protein